MRMAFMMTAVVLSMWISNTATAAILVPILLGTLPEDEDANSGSVLAIAYAASVGGMGTLIGSPPNFITVRFLEEQAGTRFDFLQWMGIGAPAALVLVVIVGFVLQWLAPPPPAETSVAVVASPWSRGERVTAFCFGLAVVGWTVPGIMRAVGAPNAEAVARALPIGAVAILAAAPLFLILDENRETPVLPWHDAVRIDWGLILLFGGGLSLGAQMFETGLAAAISQWFLGVTGISSMWGLTAALIVFTVFFTEACSNTASSNTTSFGRRSCRELCVHVADRHGAERRRLRDRLDRAPEHDSHRLRAEHRSCTDSSRSVVWIEHLLWLDVALPFC
jgi:sodium-dependent dicarboxylate transporter 2/3/5